MLDNTEICTDSVFPCTCFLLYQTKRNIFVLSVLSLKQHIKQSGLVSHMVTRFWWQKRIVSGIGPWWSAFVECDRPIRNTGTYLSRSRADRFWNRAQSRELDIQSLWAWYTLGLNVWVDLSTYRSGCWNVTQCFEIFFDSCLRIILCSVDTCVLFSTKLGIK